MRNKSREAFRNEWKYLISTSEKEMLTLRLKPFLQPDPHAGEGGYYIRSLYFEDYWNSAYAEKEAGVLMRKNTGSGFITIMTNLSNWSGKRSLEVIFTKRVHRLQEKRWRKS